jgi:hypothetical protein
MLAEPPYVATILCLLVVLAEWLSHRKFSESWLDVDRAILAAARPPQGVLAIAMERGDLRLPSILAGSLGNAIGTYAGLVIA